MNRTINANNKTVASSFEYGTTASYGSTIVGSPASVTGLTTTDIDAYLGSLSINTQYHYRAVGTVSAVPTNGSDMTFYTLAATPGTVAVDNPQLTTLSVEIDNVTQNGNPAYTQYAIQTGSQYVQANGSLGATAVWQTAATWGYQTVTGLTSSTNYTFRAKARNGDNVETVFGADASETTLTPALVDFNIIQAPKTTQNILEGTALDVYIKAYEPGLTDTPGEKANLHGWVGYSSTNDNPANAGWTWVPATFNVEVLNDDEYRATLSGLAPGKYYYAGRFQIGDGPYVYGGSAGNWNNDSVELNVEADVVNYANIQFPATATITACNGVDIFAQVYEPGITEAAGQGSGISAEIGYSSLNSNPNTVADWTWVATTFNVQAGNNDEYKATLGAGLAPGTYYYASRFIKNGKSQYVYGGTGGVWNNDSGVLTVNALGTPVATAATNIADTSFTANWNAVTDATSYELEVYSLQAGTSVTNNYGFEGDTNFPTGWVGTGYVQNTAGTANTGTYFAGLNANTKYIRTDLITNPTSLSFSYRYSSGTANNTVKVQVSSDGSNWTDYQSYVATGSGASTTYSASTITLNLTGTYYIQWIMTARSGGSFYFDDVSIVSGTAAVKTPVAGSPFTIAAPTTSYDVTGLDAATAYFYKVRAVNGSCTSSTSNEITNRVVWNGTAWSNVTGPTADLEVIVAGPFVTGAAPQNDFTAKKLTIATGGSVQITAGHHLKVENELINTRTADEFVVESDGNFWQTNPAAVNVGAITVKRAITIKDNQQYNYLSSPTGSNLKTNIYGTGNSAPFALYHNESNNSFGNSSGAYVKGRGLAVKEPATGTGIINAIFKGVPMNEAFSFTLANSNVGTGTTLGYNLLGNPYPSNIDLNLLYNLGTNEDKISTTFYFWDNAVNGVTAQGGTGYNGAAYAVFNAAAGSTGTGLGAGSLNGGTVTGTKVPNGIVQTGQGFMVKSISTTDKSLDFDNSIRLAAAGIGFYGKGMSGAVADDRFYLKLAAPSNVTTQTVVVYFPAGNDAFAKDDSQMFGTPSDVVYTFAENQKVIINGKGTFAPTDQVAVGARMFTSGTYTFSLGTQEGVFAGAQAIYLKDYEAGTLTNLSQGDYSFTANAGESAGRFEIIYRPEILLLTDNKVKEGVVVYRDGNDFVIKSPKIISAIQVYELSGKLIAEVKPTSKHGILDATTMLTGMYVLKITTADGAVTNKKIIK